MKTPKETPKYRPIFRLRNARSRQNLLLSALCSLALILASCGSDNPTDPGGNGGNGNGNGNGNGDETPTEATYANVQSIFNNSCTTSGCHDSATSQSGVDLSSYDAIMNSVGSQYGENVVKPNDADNSPLVDKIEPNPEEGARMPEGGSALSDDQINLIKEWINNGANENEDTSNDDSSNGTY